MDMNMVYIGIICLLLGAFIGYYIRKRIGEKQIGSAEEKSKEIIEDAKKKAQNIQKEAELKAKEEVYKLKQSAEKEIAEKQKEVLELEKKLRQREHHIDKRGEFVEEKERELKSLSRRLEEEKREIANLRDSLSKKERELSEKLYQIAKLSEGEARKLILDRTKEELKVEIGRMVMESVEKAKEESEQKAKEIIATAIQRYAGEYVGELTVSVIPLPNDEMKGRIIGREGRNIRTFESLTGVDVIIDDTPLAVVLSSQNSIRRELARIAMTKLIEDGRIHPARIEEVVNKSKEELEARIKKYGEEAVMDVGLPELHPELVKEIGKLKFRMSYSQNIYNHSIEVAHIAGIIAAELSLDQKFAKKAGLLHDIGKAVDHEIEGTHAEIGAELLKRVGENEDLIEAVRTHHNDKPANIYGVIIQAADALSAARPGVRKEMYEAYVKRVNQLEEIASTFPGVEKAYAIQAGRELRIFVNADKVKDEEAAFLAREVVKKIEDEIKYPGQIKVVVLREFRAVEYAK
jgi:ribonuclease Y